MWEAGLAWPLCNKPGRKQCFRSAGWVLRAHCVPFQGISFQSQQSVHFPSYYTCLDAGDLEKKRMKGEDLRNEIHEHFTGHVE